MPDGFCSEQNGGYLLHQCGRFRSTTTTTRVNRLVIGGRSILLQLLLLLLFSLPVPEMTVG